YIDRSRSYRGPPRRDDLIAPAHDPAVGRAQSQRLPYRPVQAFDAAGPVRDRRRDFPPDEYHEHARKQYSPAAPPRRPRQPSTSVADTSLRSGQSLDGLARPCSTQHDRAGAGDGDVDVDVGGGRSCQ
ncbi:hypothetical protein KEM52_003055, partial [Ascosphaera acerosa]